MGDGTPAGVEGAPVDDGGVSEDAVDWGLAVLGRRVLTSTLASPRPASDFLDVKLVSLKIIRNKIIGQPEGYGFVEFVSHAAAKRVLHTYNGTQMPGTALTFRLNYTSSGMGERRAEARPEHSIFVGDLAPDVPDYMLQEAFQNHYSSVREAKVVTDPHTARFKGYGFLKFSDDNEKQLFK